MIIKYDIDIDNETIQSNLKRIINQVYKLLPIREEGAQWEKPLKTIIVELGGMKRLLVSQQDLLFAILCKLEGLFELTDKQQFLEYRRTIFECLSLLNILQKNVQRL